MLWRCSRIALRHQSWRNGWISRRSFVLAHWLQAPHQSNYAERTDDSQIRNIGIIAHIDAGKTTTTERMLFYGGYTKRIGDVDDGSTVTDFLPAERARGITIQSAAVSFQWPISPKGSSPDSGKGSSHRSDEIHQINLIDTPGHADFTFEVLRSLRVLDGAVCILDGVAGVEAQTEQVWQQANTYSIPRLAYVNKLDRDGASFAKTVQDIASKLQSWPAVCSIPWWENGKGRLQGIGDAITLRGLLWQKDSDGSVYQTLDISELKKTDAAFAEELLQARTALVELLCEHDDTLVEHFLESGEDHSTIGSGNISEALRRCVLADDQQVIPVFAGASFRNIGVQPLLNNVVDLLPSPNERPDPEVTVSSTKTTLSHFLKDQASNVSGAGASQPSGKKQLANKKSMEVQKLEACALAFKVVHDARRGVLVYVRVYHGTLPRNALLYNTSLKICERAQRLLKMYANDALDIDTIHAGQIGVIPALKYARTGDTLISVTGMNVKLGAPAPLNTLQLRPIDVPPPVFFRGVQPVSRSEEKQTQESLALLLREDPSLSISVDEDTAQTQLAGMGELHLEIAKDRLVNDLKAKVNIGEIEIGYREALLGPSQLIAKIYERDVGGTTARASCSASVTPLDELAQPHDSNEQKSASAHTQELPDGNSLTIDLNLAADPHSSTSEGQSKLPGTLKPREVLAAVTAGASAALSRGPRFHYPMHSLHVLITLNVATDVFPNTTLSALSAAARSAVQSALHDAQQAHGAIIIEPVMHTTLSVDEANMGAVIHDLSAARGAHILSLGNDSDSPSSSDRRTINHTRIYYPPDPYASSTDGPADAVHARPRSLHARVPLSEMVGYLKHLRSLTGGRATFTMRLEGFERMSAKRQKALLSAREWR